MALHKKGFMGLSFSTHVKPIFSTCKCFKGMAPGFVAFNCKIEWLQVKAYNYIIINDVFYQCGNIKSNLNAYHHCICYVGYYV